MEIKGILRREMEGKDPRLLHAMEMIADKLTRLTNKPDHYDSWLDVAGYARTALMVLDHSPTGVPWHGDFLPEAEPDFEDEVDERKKVSAGQTNKWLSEDSGIEE